MTHFLCNDFPSFSTQGTFFNIDIRVRLYCKQAQRILKQFQLQYTIRSYLQQQIRPGKQILGKQIRPTFLRSTITLQNLANKSGCVQTKLLYVLYITPEVKQYYEALFLSYRPQTKCSISQIFRQIALIQYSEPSKHAWAISKTVQKNFQNYIFGQPVLTFDKRQIFSEH